MTKQGALAGPIFTSPLGLFPFQVDGTARTYLAWTDSDEPVRLAIWETGLGKTVLSIAATSMLFEDDAVDIVIVVAEANKVLDWAKVDYPKFAPSLNVNPYTGSIAQRRKILEDPPQVLVMSYQTGKNDICAIKPRGRAVTGEKMLSRALVGKRVAFVFDEFSVLRTRSSQTYIAWDYLINRLLRKPHLPPPKILALTATPVESSPENHWNASRILAPWRAGRVEDFGSSYVQSYDLFGNPSRWKNLTPLDSTDPHVIPLSERFAPITLRKRKTDEDVMDQFPSKMEEGPTWVDLDPAHDSLYESVESIFREDGVDEFTQRQGFGILRQLAGHPASLLRSQGKYAREIVESVGVPYIESLRVTKVDAMLDWLSRYQGQQTVIFTFYGQSILPILEHTLRSHDYKVSVNHGGLSKQQRQDAKDAFVRGDTQVFLTSDAGAKGLNLGVGSGLLHYEMPPLWSTYEQRSNRIHRIDSRHPSVTIDHLIARNTVEEACAALCWKRNDWSERVVDGDYFEDSDPSEKFLRASDRLAALRRGRG